MVRSVLKNFTPFKRRGKRENRWKEKKEKEEERVHAGRRRDRWRKLC